VGARTTLKRASNKQLMKSWYTHRTMIGSLVGKMLEAWVDEAMLDEIDDIVQPMASDEVFPEHVDLLSAAGEAGDLANDLVYLADIAWKLEKRCREIAEIRQEIDRRASSVAAATKA